MPKPYTARKVKVKEYGKIKGGGWELSTSKEREKIELKAVHFYCM